MVRLKGKKKKKILADLKMRNYIPAVGGRVFTELQPRKNVVSECERSRFLIKEWV